jgi:ParB-like chromosome segregation protein Spo0J
LQRSEGQDMAGRKVEQVETTVPAAEWVEVSKLTMWVKNPRKNDENVARVVESIKRFGFGAPIVARKENGEIIAGHTRLKAALVLKLKQVPVRYLDISEHEAHLLALADNRLNELSPWDVDGLQEVMGEFSLEDVALAGWSSEDIEKMGGDLAYGGLPELGDEPSHTQVTFTLSHRQKAIVDAAIDAAKARGFVADDNANSNGNALEAVCVAFHG